MAAAKWTVKHLEHDGTVLSTFKPENLTFSLEKGENGPHTVSYELSRGNDSVTPAFVGPYRTDFELYSDTDLIVAGMHTLFNVESDQEHVKIGGKGWLHYLQKRYWPFDPNDPNAYRKKAGLAAPDDDDPPTGYAYAVTGIDSMDIIGDMLDMITADPNSLEITHSLVDIGHDPVFSIDLIDTESIYDKIVTLSQEDPGEFDFWVTNAKVFQRAAPRLYSLDVVEDEEHADIEHIFDSEVLDSGLHSVGFTNTGPVATRLRGTGSSQSTTLASVREFFDGSAEFRLLEDNISFGHVNTQSRVVTLTRKHMLFGVNPVHEITITVVSDRIANFWTRFKPGKAIWLKANLEGWNIDSAQEIVTMTCNPDNAGNELVTMRLNQIYAAVGIS
jgi:hypothetical protein